MQPDRGPEDPSPRDSRPLPRMSVFPLRQWGGQGSSPRCPQVDLSSFEDRQRGSSPGLPTDPPFASLASEPRGRAHAGKQEAPSALPTPRWLLAAHCDGSLMGTQGTRSGLLLWSLGPRMARSSWKPAEGCLAPTTGRGLPVQLCLPSRPQQLRGRPLNATEARRLH